MCSMTAEQRDISFKQMTQEAIPLDELSLTNWFNSESSRFARHGMPEKQEKVELKNLQIKSIRVTYTRIAPFKNSMLCYWQLDKLL
jgi:hypothetical protein